MVARTILADRPENMLRGKSGWRNLHHIHLTRVGDRVWIYAYSQRIGKNPPAALDLDTETAHALAHELLNVLSMEEPDA